MRDRDDSNAQSASENNDQNDGQGPELRTDRVLLTEKRKRDLDSCSRTELNGKPDGSQCDSNESAAGEPMTVQLTIEQLIDDHSRFLFGYAYRLAGSVSDAEDLTQQTFLISHQKLTQLRSAAAAKSWLCAILRSCWLKSIRRNQPKPLNSDEFEWSELVDDVQPEIEFDSQAIQIALDDLPPDYRLVLLMYYFEELSYQEIADRLKVKIGTVMSRLSRAKERVRQKLRNKDSLLDK